jgi:uncharacterized membrane protein YvbJ
MSLITCPECEKQISDTALSCPNCGFQLSEKTLSKQKVEKVKKGFHDSFDEEDEIEESNFHDSFDNPIKETTSPKLEMGQKKSNLPGFIALIVIILALVYFMTSNNSSNSVPWEKADANIEAYVMSQDFVSSRLVSPSTASFPLTASESTTRIDGQQYRIKAYVDSQNAFGGTLRTNFTAIVEQYEKGKWKLIDLQMY